MDAAVMGDQVAAALDPRRLLTFRAVAHRGSFSRAAEALALTQPAVSQQLAALERQLGTRLLDRGPGGVAPTEAGSVLLAHADALADRLALAGSQLGELVGAEARRLRLGAFPSALATIVPAAIARLRQAEPELEVSVVDDSSPALAERVGEGELHLAVCFQDAAIERREHPGGGRAGGGGRPPPGRLLPGRRDRARRAPRPAPPRPHRGADGRGPAAGPPTGRAHEHPYPRSRRGDLDRPVGERAARALL